MPLVCRVHTESYMVNSYRYNAMIMILKEDLYMYCGAYIMSVCHFYSTQQFI